MWGQLRKSPLVLERKEKSELAGVEVFFGSYTESGSLRTPGFPVSCPVCNPKNTI